MSIHITRKAKTIQSFVEEHKNKIHLWSIEPKNTVSKTTLSQIAMADIHIESDQKEMAFMDQDHHTHIVYPYNKAFKQAFLYLQMQEKSYFYSLYQGIEETRDVVKKQRAETLDINSDAIFEDKEMQTWMKETGESYYIYKNLNTAMLVLYLTACLKTNKADPLYTQYYQYEQRQKDHPKLGKKLQKKYDEIYKDIKTCLTASAKDAVLAMRKLSQHQKDLKKFSKWRLNPLITHLQDIQNDIQNKWINKVIQKERYVIENLDQAMDQYVKQTHRPKAEAKEFIYQLKLSLNQMLQEGHESIFIAHEALMILDRLQKRLRAIMVLKDLNVDPEKIYNTHLKVHLEDLKNISQSFQTKQTGFYGMFQSFKNFFKTCLIRLIPSCQKWSFFQSKFHQTEQALLQDSQQITRLLK